MLPIHKGILIAPPKRAKQESSIPPHKRKEDTRMRVEKSITINAPVDKVYSMWTDFESFPSFMKHVESITRSDNNKLHWKAQIGPITKEWEAQVQALVPNRSVT